MAGINAYSGGPGIAQISRRDRLPEPQLPAGDSAPPIDGALQLKLPGVLFRPSLDQALTEALEPDIHHRSILQPERFQSLIDSSRDQLEQEAQAIEDESNRERLREAIGVLERTADLRDALRLLRSLVQRA